VAYAASEATQDIKKLQLRSSIPTRRYPTTSRSQEAKTYDMAPAKDPKYLTTRKTIPNNPVTAQISHVQKPLQKPQPLSTPL
jgi:hypothetical protein